MVFLPLLLLLPLLLTRGREEELKELGIGGIFRLNKRWGRKPSYVLKKEEKRKGEREKRKRLNALLCGSSTNKTPWEKKGWMMR
jgi:hypothetical protein